MTVYNLPFEECDALKRIRSLAGRLAKSSLSIYVTGEPGTGRETLARGLADVTAAPIEPLDLVVAGSLDSSLLARQADGTVRVIVAANPEFLDRRIQVLLASATARGSMRLFAWGACGWLERAEPELRYLLEPGVVTLPPLRERGRDILEWATLFLKRASPVSAPVLSHPAEDVVLRNSWPGNLDQLDATLRRALAVREPGDVTPISASELTGTGEEDQDGVLPLAEAVEKFRESYVLRTLERFAGNRSQAARALRVDPRTVFRFLEGRRKPDGGST